MNKMYEYLKEHAYISKNKKSNYQFELTRQRAECIANKHNSLCEEKDKEIERLNNIINKIDEYANKLRYYADEDDKEYRISKDIHNIIQELKGDDNNE